MRTIALGLLLAAAGTAPAFAAAQDQEHPHHHEGRPAGDHPHDGGRPVSVPQAAQPPQGYQRPAHGGYHPQGGDGRFQGMPGRQDYRRGDRRDGAPPMAPGSGGYRPQPGQYGYRPNGGPPVAPGSGGYRPQPGQPGYHPNGGLPGAPGSGGYRPQPGQPGYRPEGGPPVAPGSGGYRPQPDQYGYRSGGPGGGYRPAPPTPGRDGGWNRGWRDDRHYDYRSYRVQNNYVFRLQPYYAPRGWGYGYRRFSPGFTLSAFLFDQDYWIDDPFSYRLPPAWGPYRWVRYYNDALLVDTRSGIVVDAVYGIFWQ